METSIIPVPAVNVALIHSKGDQVLLTRRSASVREPHKWCLPGGHLEFGESLLDAALRETEEEIGLRPLSAELCGIYSDPMLTVTSDPVTDGKRAQFVVAVFIAYHFEGEIRPNDEVDAYEWFNLENLPTPMVKSHPIRVKDALQFNGKVFVR